MNVQTSIKEADVKAIATGLIPALRERELQTDADRKVPEENIRLLAESGLLGICRSKKWGGSELTMRAHVDAASTLAEGCHATAWVLGVYHAHDYIIGHMSEEAQADIYSTSPSQAVAAVISPRGKAVKQEDGSYLLSGFWPFASGNAHSDWLLLGGKIEDAEGNILDEGDFAVPADQVVRLDDWHVAGLQGTGSSSVKCENVHVPGHRFISMPSVLENQSRAFSSPDTPTIHKSQAGPALGMFIATSSLGAAKRCLEEFRKVVPGKMVMYTSHISHEWSAIQQAAGKAASLIHAAELVTYKMADDIDEWAAKGEKMPMELRARIRADICTVPAMCRDAAQLLMRVGGAAGLSLRSPIQLNARNSFAATMHGLLLEEVGTEIYGRVLLGQDPGTPIL